MSVLQVDKIQDAAGTTNKELAQYASSKWSWGAGIPAGSIVQVKHYTFTTAKDYTGVADGAYRWVTDSIKGGSSDYITFDNPIKSGNHVLIYFNAPVTTSDGDVEYVKFFIREGTATTDGINAGSNVASQSANGITCMCKWYSQNAEHGSITGTISFTHKFAPTAVTGSTITNPNLSIVSSFNFTQLLLPYYVSLDFCTLSYRWIQPCYFCWSYSCRISSMGKCVK